MIIVIVIIISLHITLYHGTIFQDDNDNTYINVHFHSSHSAQFLLIFCFESRLNLRLGSIQLQFLIIAFLFAKKKLRLD